MSYEVAINKAWESLGQFKPKKPLAVKFLADDYIIDCQNRQVTSSAGNIPAKEHLEILILHYLVQKFKGLPALSGEWVYFKELESGEIYYPAFRKRAIEPILRKYGDNPQGLFSVLERLPAEKVKQGDVGIIVQVLENVPFMFVLWQGDSEFGPEANLLFDKSIAGIFNPEDVAVLAGFVARQI
jgi:hypothetical protein